VGISRILAIAFLNSLPGFKSQVSEKKIKTRALLFSQLTEKYFSLLGEFFRSMNIHPVPFLGIGRTIKDQIKVP